MRGPLKEDPLGSVRRIGYEGRSVDELIDLVRDAGITVLVDVRLNAVSRKPGLSKNRLASRLHEVGIRYEHAPTLGNPRDNRDGYRSGDPAARRRYDEILSNGSSSEVDRVIALACRESVALLCFERNADECHRAGVIDEINRRQPSLAHRPL